MKKMNVIILLVIIFGWIGCSSEQEKKSKPNVKVMQISQVDSVNMKSYSGRIRAARETNLAFRVAGPILKIYVEEGQKVRKGQLLAEIDPRDYEIQLAGTRAQYNQVLDEYHRMKSLFDKNRIAENDFNKIRSGLQQLEAKLHAHENMLKDTKLIAPFNGYVQKKYFEESETVNRGIPVISLISNDYLDVESYIPSSMYVQANRFIRYECQSDLYPEQVIPLELIDIQHKANLNQLYGIKLRMKRLEKFRLAPGMNVQVKIYYKNSFNNSIRIPVESVLHENGISYVWVLNSADSTVSKRPVKAGKVFADGNIQIEEGIQPEDIIVISGMNYLHDGETVRVLRAPSVTNVGGLL